MTYLIDVAPHGGNLFVARESCQAVKACTAVALFRTSTGTVSGCGDLWRRSTCIHQNPRTQGSLNDISSRFYRRRIGAGEYLRKPLSQGMSIPHDWGRQKGIALCRAVSKMIVTPEKQRREHMMVP